LEQQVLSANPILESFGNAQTIRNNNSSRFGKFIRIEFNFAGQIAGANIEWYLLEKPRVTNQSKQERNYHIFYQFMKGAHKSIKDKLLIDKGPEGYTFTQRCRQTIQGVDDAAEFEMLVKAMTTTGFRAEEQADLFRIIAAILHLGNVQFQATRNDEAVLREQVAAEKLCHVLGIQLSDFTRALLRPSIKAGKDWVTQSRTLQQVTFSVEALARSMYERMFGALVSRINSAMSRPDGKSTFIGVLDIAGFEILETNSFEQLCINYTNERLQQFFNRTMFVLEQEEYKREGIEWNFIDFGMDLQPTIELIDRTKPIGIMSCLDEECVMPKATDKTFTEKLHGLWAGKSDKYDVPRFALGFIVKHYASQVEYSTEGWLEKNKDPLNENVTRLLGNSSEGFVAQLYADYADSDSGTSEGGQSNSGGGGGRSRVVTTLKRGAFRTVGQRHKDQLNMLMAQLHSTQPHFVRCILPNSEKRAGKIDTPLVLDQLRCNGVLEGIRITRQGFPNRVAFPEFRQRYEILAPNTIPRQVFVDSKQAASLLLDALKMDKAKYRLGHTKVFFRAGVLAELEEIRDVELSKIITQFQAVARGALSRSRFRRRIEQARAIRVIQRNARVYNELSEWPWWKLYRTVKPLLHVTRVDEEMRKKESRIAELEAKVRAEEEERRRLETGRHDLERAKSDIEALLISERSAALDQEEILKRTQEREVELAERLREQEAKADDLEEQASAEAEQARAEVEQARADLKQARAELEQAKASLEQHQQSNEALSSASAEAAEYRVALEHIEADHGLALERIGELETFLAQSRDIEAQAAQELVHMQQELAQKEDELAQKEGELAQREGDLGARFEAAAAESERLGVRLAAAEQTLGSAQQDKQRLADANARLVAEIDDLRRLIDEKADQGTRESEIRRMREGELSALRAELADATAKLEDIRRAHIDATSEAEQLRRERDQAEANGQAVEAQLLEHAARMEEMEAANMELEAANTELEAANTELEAANTQLTAQLAEASAKSRSIETEYADTRQTHDAAAAELAALKAVVAAMEAQGGEAQRALALAQRTAQELQARLDENEAMRDEYQLRITTQSQEYEELKGEHEELKAKHQQRSAAQSQLEKANAEAVAERDDLRGAYHDLEAQLQDARLAAEREGAHALELEQANAEFKAQHDALTAQAAELRAQAAQAQAEAAGLHARLEEASASHGMAQEVKARGEAQHKEIQDKLLREVAAKEAQAEDARRQLLQEVADLGKRLDAEASEREKADRARAAADAELQRLRLAADSASRGRDDADAARRDASARLLQAEADAEALRRAVDDYKALADRHERKAGAQLETITARDLELTQLGRKLQRVERRLEEVMAQAAYHLDARNRLDSENVELREKLDDAYRQQGSADDLSRGLSNAADSSALVRRAEAQAAERVHAAEESRLALTQALQAAQREVEDKQHELVDLDRSFGSLQDELEAARSALLGAERDRDDARDALSGLRAQLAAERSLRGSNEGQAAELSDRLDAMRETLATYEASMRDAADERQHADNVAASARAEARDALDALADAVRARDAAEAARLALESRVLDLQARLDDSALAVDELEHVRAALQRELGAVSDRHRGDVDDQDRAIDGMRATYQKELEDTTRELEATKKDHIDLREAYISLDSSLALKTQELDRANEDAADAKKELMRVMAKLEEIAPAYERARDAAKALEARMETAKHERDSAVAKAAEAKALYDEMRSVKEKLETRLDEVQNKYIEASQGRQTAEKAALQLEDKVRSARARLEEINDDQSSAEERVARLDAVVADAHLALDKEREANTILTKDKNALERQLKEMKLRIVNLETEALAHHVKGTKRFQPIVPADLSAQIEAQAKASLEHQQKAKQMERQIRELQFQIGEKDKSKQRADVDLQRMSGRIKRLEDHVKELEFTGEKLTSAKHRLERELGALRSRNASPAFS
ncbi:class II myosin, partial [Coemansia sp. RSA 922]